MSSQTNETRPSSQNCLPSSANTLCSMETVDVYDPAIYCCGGETDDHESDGVQAKPWGRLLPLGSMFSAVDLCNAKYAFGRGDECEVTFDDPDASKSSNVAKYLACSKRHFILTREHNGIGNGKGKGKGKGDHVFLEDTSSNGTFINGTKVGKRNRHALNNNDEIALATARNRAYVYLDVNAGEDEQLPLELRSKYTVSRVIGRGACGEVRLAFTKGSCDKFAIKLVSKHRFSVDGKSRAQSSGVMNEVKLLRALKHPCVVEVHDVVDSPSTLFIVLDLVEGGDLFDRVQSSKRLSEPVAKFLFYQLVVAIKYLHEQGITHRDLKLENVLLSSDDEQTLIKVTDFGLSKLTDDTRMMQTFCGTPDYLAPEVLSTAGSGSYTNAIDCWSLGVILFMCLGGYPPFSDEYKDMPLHKQILKGRYKFAKSVWSETSADAIDMIKAFITVDPNERLTTERALDRAWLDDRAMVRAANKLMFPEGDRTIERKRHLDKSDETLDGDSDCTNSMANASDLPNKRPAINPENSTSTSTNTSLSSDPSIITQHDVAS